MKPFFVDLSDKDKREDVIEELRQLTEDLADHFLAHRGHNSRVIIQCFIQKDMWDNYGDYLRVNQLDEQKIKIGVQ